MDNLQRHDNREKMKKSKYMFCSVRLVKGEELIGDDWSVSYKVASMLQRRR